MALDDWPEEIVAVLLAEVLDADLDVFEMAVVCCGVGPLVVIVGVILAEVLDTELDVFEM